MKRFRNIMAIILLISIILPSLAQAVPESKAAPKELAERLFGSTRVETSIKVSDRAYPQGSKNIVLSGWNGQADGLTGTLLAAKLGAPLIIVSDLYFDSVKAQLRKLGAKNIYLLGGNTVISQEIESSLKAGGYTVKRLAGEDRIGTAVEIAKEVAGKSKQAFLTNDGRRGSLADALAVGPVSGINQDPIFLTGKDKVAKETIGALKELQITKLTIVGGETVVSKSVVSQLEKAGFTVARLAGDNREKTAVEIARKFFPASKKVIVVNDGRVSLADALVGGYLGAKEKMPILLTRANRVSIDTKEYLLKKMDFAYILGGKNVIDEATFTTIKKILSGEYVEPEPEKPIEKPNNIKIETRGLVFSVGKSSDQIRLLKDFFRARGVSNIAKDHIYDNKTKELVMDYQRSKALKADGIAGNVTLNKINQEIRDKNYKIGLYIPYTSVKGDMIIINKSSNTLYFMKNGVIQNTYPVATGKTDDLTPNGKFKIVVKLKNPAWGGAGKYKPIAGGAANNPLGKRWMGISHGGGGEYGVHGNANPASIGTYASLGCVRMFNPDVEKLYEKVKVGTAIWIGSERQLKSYGVKFKFKYNEENARAKMAIESSEEDLNSKESVIDSTKYYSFDEIYRLINGDPIDKKEIEENMEVLGGYDLEFLPEDDQ